MKVRGAFSLVEVLVVCGIIITLASIAYPVYSSARESAKIQSSLSRLRQMQMAVMVYRSDYESESIPKSLPPYEYVYSTYLGLGEDFFRSPCGYRGILVNTKELGYQYNFYAENEAIENYWNKAGELGILFIDPSCNPSRAIWESPPALKRGLAVRLNGELLNKYKRGSTFGSVRFFH